MDKINRDRMPLSPHLTIYRPQNTSILSILHRLTGIGLFFPTLIMVMWIISIPLGPYYFGIFQMLLQSFFGTVFLGISLWALLYHTLTGVRHLIWDLGYGVSVKWVNISTWMIVFGSFGVSGLIMFLRGSH